VIRLHVAAHEVVGVEARDFVQLDAGNARVVTDQLAFRAERGAASAAETSSVDATFAASTHSASPASTNTAPPTATNSAPPAVADAASPTATNSATNSAAAAAKAADTASGTAFPAVADAASATAVDATPPDHRRDTAVVPITSVARRSRRLFIQDCQPSSCAATERQRQQ
jgi:hypothetical protein